MRPAGGGVVATALGLATSLVLWNAVNGGSQPRSGSAAEGDVGRSLERLPAVSIPPGQGQPASRPVRFGLPGGLTGWAVPLEGGRPIATPAVSDGRVYVGGGFGSFDLYAFDAATGEPVWRARTTDDGPTGVVVEGEYLALNTESCTLEIRGKTTAGSSGGGGWGTR